MLVIDCPVPPSLNRLWRFKNAKGTLRIYKDTTYDRWLQSFWFCWLRDKPKSFKTIEGPIEAEILLCPRRKRDADNSAKALMDAMQAIGIIKNDSQARKVTQELVNRDRAPQGCRLMIVEL